MAPVTAYLLLPGAFVPSFYALMALYLVYALVVAFRGSSHTGMLGLLALFGDTVFFLIFASYGGERMLWPASVFFLFLLGEALAFYSTVEVVVIVVVCALFCAVLPLGAQMLERTVVVAGILACAFAMNKQQQSAEIERL